MKFQLIFLYLFVIFSNCQEVTSFGHSYLEDFSLNKNLINVNSGSYGVTPKIVMDKKFEYYQESERNPDVWYRKTLEPQLTQVREKIAKYINAKSKDDIVFVENASDGFNSVVKSLQIFDWTKGDKIISTNISYSMVKKTIEYLKTTYQIDNAVIEFTLEDIQTQDSLYDAWVRGVEQNPGIKLAVLDHISSAPGLIFPIKRIIEYLHSKNIKVVVDAAHAVGQIELNVEEYGADFYFSNFYKWGYSPKAVSFLWINTEKYADKIHPNIIGKLYSEGWEKEFFWTGTRDFSNYLAVKDAIEYREQLGEKKILSYMKNTCDNVGRRVSRMWGTHVMTQDPKLTAGMINIQFPSSNFELCTKVQNRFFEESGIYTVFLKFQEQMYVRFSCQIFNEVTDFLNVASRLQHILKEERQQIQKTEI